MSPFWNLWTIRSHAIYVQKKSASVVPHIVNFKNNNFLVTKFFFHILKQGTLRFCNRMFQTFIYTSLIYRNYYWKFEFLSPIHIDSDYCAPPNCLPCFFSSSKVKKQKASFVKLQVLAEFVPLIKGSSHRWRWTANCAVIPRSNSVCTCVLIFLGMGRTKNYLGRVGIGLWSGNFMYTG